MIWHTIVISDISMETIYMLFEVQWVLIHIMSPKLKLIWNYIDNKKNKIRKFLTILITELVHIFLKL